MSRGDTASETMPVGAEDFLARYAPNLSRKERSSLTSLVRHAVRDYMEENRLTQPPPHRLLAAFEAQRRPRSAAFDGGTPAPRWRHRPRTAFGGCDNFGENSGGELAAEDGRGDDCNDGGRAGEEEDFCLVGNSTGIPTGTPRYAMVSPKFAPPPATLSTAPSTAEGRLHGFPATLMGFVGRDADATSTKQQPQQQQQQQGEQKKVGAAPAAAAAAAAAATSKRPATAAGNWLTWRGATPFCANDRDLRAFRHRQNPKKPMPEELPHVAMYRPYTARGGQPSGLQQHPTAASERSPVDRGILDWMQGANEHDKRVAYNLMKAMESGRTDGLEAFSRDAVAATAAAAPRPDRRLRSHVKREDQHTFGRRTRPQTPLTMRRALHREAGAEEPKVLFSGVEEDFRAARSRVHPLRPAVDYVHTGSGFCNASPPYRSNFAVHPDWVSEQVPRVPPLALRTGRSGPPLPARQ